MSLAGKPISSYRLRRREIAWTPLLQRLPRKPPLIEWVLLSMLLHALAILLFGAPPGGSSDGRAMWGSLQVVLTGLASEEGPPLKLDRGAIEAKPQPAAPSSAPAPSQAVKPSLRAAPRIEPAAPAVEAPPLPQAAPQVEPIVIPPVLERLVVPERPIETPFTVPPPTPEQAPTPVPAVIAPAPPPAAPPKQAPVEVPRVPTTLMQPIAPSPVNEMRLAPTPELQLPKIETRAPLPSLAEPPVITQPLEMKPIAPPRIQELAPAPIVTQPLEARPLPAPRIEELAPAPVVTQPIEAKPLAAPRVEQMAPIPDIETIAKPAPAPAVREVPVTPPPVATPTPSPSSAAPTAVPQAEPRAEPRIEPQLQRPPGSEREAPSTPAPSPRPTPGPAPGTPGAPSEFRKNPQEPSSDYDPFAAPKSIDLDAMKRRAGELARGTGNTAVLPFPMPAVPPKKSRIEEALDKAHKPDCRTAYAQMGLLAVVPLVANEFGEGTCRW